MKDGSECRERQAARMTARRIPAYRHELSSSTLAMSRIYAAGAYQEWSCQLPLQPPATCMFAYSVCFTGIETLRKSRYVFRPGAHAEVDVAGPICSCPWYQALIQKRSDEHIYFRSETMLSF